MIAYKKGMVVLVPFPFSDQTTAKKGLRLLLVPIFITISHQISLSWL